MKSVDNPRIVALELEHASPGLVGLQGERLLLGLEIDEPPAPGLVGEAAPFGRDERRVVAILARTDDAGVLVEGEGEVRLMGQARPFEDDFGAKFGHGGRLTFCEDKKL
jgi:hypothetical protein